MNTCIPAVARLRKSKNAKIISCVLIAILLADDCCGALSKSDSSALKAVQSRKLVAHVEVRPATNCSHQKSNHALFDSLIFGHT